MLYESERIAVCDYAKRMRQAGLVVGSAGNVSMRAPKDGHYVITPSSVPYEALTPDQIVIVDDEEDLVEGERAPSFETPLHLSVYHARADVGAVFHTHARYSTVLAALRRPIPPVVEEMVVYIGGPVEVAEYAASGSDALAKNAVKTLGEKAAIMLANHGQLCVGKDLASAFKICELVEHVAYIYVTASLLGTPVQLPDNVIAYEKEMYQIVKTM